MIKQDVFFGMAYHKPAPYMDSSVFQPIHAGAELTDQSLPFAIPDNSGDNISKRSPTWRELTAIYWMWKNVEADFYGFCQNKKIPIFSRRFIKNSFFLELSPNEVRRFGWNKKSLYDIIAQNDVITHLKSHVHPAGVPEKTMTVYDKYRQEHFIDDLETLIDTCKEEASELYPFLVASIRGHHMRGGDFFLMRKNLFEKYATWLFATLFAAEKKINIGENDPYQQRVFVFLAEILTEAFFIYAQQIEKVSVKEIPYAFGLNLPPTNQANITRVSPGQRSNPMEPQDQTIEVLYCLDEAYIPHAAASIMSMLMCARNTFCIRISILHFNKLDHERITGLQSIVSEFGAQCRFVQADDEELCWLPLNLSWTSNSTYLRLVGQKYLPDLDRIIYLDADTILCDDIQNLWDTDLKGNPLAAAPDEGGSDQSHRLRLSPNHRYFNAGVLIMDLNWIRRHDLKTQIQEMFRARGDYITCQDQDILNIIFCEKTACFDLKWNANTSLFVPSFTYPSFTSDEAERAKSRPSLLHFTGNRKPWHYNCNHPLLYLYWHYRDLTPFRERGMRRLQRMIKRKIYTSIKPRFQSWSKYWKIVEV